MGGLVVVEGMVMKGGGQFETRCPRHDNASICFTYLHIMHIIHTGMFLLYFGACLRISL